MHYDNIFKRFLFRKNLIRRIKSRLKLEWRKIEKNEFSDIEYLFQLIGRKPEFILDCGANIGFVSFRFRKLFPNSVIHAFEPNPDVFKKAFLTMKSNNINYYNVGVGSMDAEITFYKNKNTGTSSFLVPNEFHSKNLAGKYDNVNIQVIRLSNFLEENNLNKVSVLKLDIEGFELEVLKDLNNYLIIGNIDLIFCEVNYTPTYKGQPLIEQIILEMRKHNYLLYNTYGVLETKNRQALITNLIFLSPKIVSEINTSQGAMTLA